jgi:transposase
MPRVVIGVDPHKASNTLVVIDSREQVVAEQRFVNDRAGYRSMKTFARAFPERTWAVEGARGVGAGLAQRLVAEDEPVLDVPAKLSARVRALGGGSGRKTDSADAFAVAVAGLRAHDLRTVRPDDVTEVLKMLTDRRQELVRERIATVNRLHEVLTQLIPGGARKNLRASTARRLLSAVRPRAVVGRARKQLALDYIGDLERLDTRLKDLKAQIADAVAAQGSSLVSIDGVGPLGAGKTLAEVIDVRRFPSKAHFASYTGTAPSTCPPGTTTGTGSTEAATAGSTTCCTSRPSPRPGCPAPARTTTGASATKARPTSKRCAASNDDSPTSSTGTWWTTWQQGAREDKWGRLFNPARLT